MSAGWIKLHRELMDKPIWESSTPEQKVILITLLMMANHAEREWEFQGEKYKAQPGQFVTSLPSIAKKAGNGISIQNVRTALNRFEKYDFLTCTSTNKNRLVTIVNWGFYQQTEDDLTGKLTGNQQATNRQLTANKNVRKKEGKKDSHKQVYDDTSPPYILAKFFLDQIRKNNPEHRQPDLQKWSDDIRKIIDLDQRDKKEVAQVIKWVQQDEFEMVNVLSPSKLRKRYDQLKMKMQKSQPVGPETTSQYKDLGDREY